MKGRRKGGREEETERQGREGGREEERKGERNEGERGGGGSAVSMCVSMS